MMRSPLLFHPARTHDDGAAERFDAGARVDDDTNDDPGARRASSAHDARDPRDGRTRDVRAHDERGGRAAQRRSGGQTRERADFDAIAQAAQALADAASTHHTAPRAGTEVDRAGARAAEAHLEGIAALGGGALLGGAGAAVPGALPGGAAHDAHGAMQMLEALATALAHGKDGAPGSGGAASSSQTHAGASLAQTHARVDAVALSLGDATPGAGGAGGAGGAAHHGGTGGHGDSGHGGAGHKGYDNGDGGDNGGDGDGGVRGADRADRARGASGDDAAIRAAAGVNAFTAGDDALTANVNGAPGHAHTFSDAMAAAAQAEARAEALLTDPGLTAVLRAHDARIAVDTGAGALLVSVHAKNGVADVSMSGAAASTLEAARPELVKALASEGLSLGQFDTRADGGGAGGQGGGNDGADGRVNAPATGAGITRASSSASHATSVRGVIA